MKTLREYVTTPGRPASTSPASRTRAADVHRSTRSSPRAASRTVASVTSRATPSRARRRARRMAFEDGTWASATTLASLRPPAGQPDGQRCKDRFVNVVALAGGIGGARFLRGLLAHLSTTDPAAQVTVIGNTGDDITLHGLR